MKITKIIILISMFFLLTGCYPGISGKVVDGLNGNPVEGAVVLAQWTTSGGLPGLTHHKVYKITETETNKEGEFSFSGVYNPFVDPPQMVIYKKGYVPWRNDMDFKDKNWTLYDDIIWKNNMTYKLEHWKEEYSKLKRYDFISIGFIGANYTYTPQFQKIMNELDDEAKPERDLKWKKK